jgi:DNA-binding NtrC family response regulator
LTRLLVVEDDNSVRNTVVTFLELENYDVDSVASTREALARLQTGKYDIVLSDIYLDERTGLDVLEAARAANPSGAVILMTGRGTMETVMSATSGGAFDYIAKPFELDRLLETIRRAEASLKPAETSDDEDVEIDDLPETEMIASSAVMVEIYKTISRIAPLDVTVLIQGETGTGKELIARMIHRYSPRAERPFVPVDCGAIAPTLAESELFGALRGSYTGADRDRVGYLEAANHGTVFLDEIGEIDTAFQLKLLRFLQEREIRPVGSTRPRQVDVRVIAATNKDLSRQVEEGKFREDLWYRLNTVPIEVPPLRDRHGDIPLLAQHFVDRSNSRFGTDARLTESGVRALAEYGWPGNVRQMQHLLERLCILAPGARIDAAAIRSAMNTLQPRDSAGETLADAETEQIRRVLAAAGGNKSRAAKILGIERKTLYRKLERMGLHDSNSADKI